MKEILIQKGKTFILPVRWESTPIVRKAITAISLATGAPRLTVNGHGLPDGWRCVVTRVSGMTQINAINFPPQDSDYRVATVIDANTIEFNQVTPVDSSGREWSPYAAGGFVEYNTPVDLAGATARMKIRNKVGGTLLASTELSDAPLNTLTANVDASGKKITITIQASSTAAFSFSRGVADLEVISSSGEVSKLKLCAGGEEEPDPVRVVGEVTT